MKNPNKLFCKKQTFFERLRLMMLRKTMLLLALVFSVSVFAQSTRQIQGTVIDREGLPVIGATVIVEGSSGIGNITNVDAVFFLEIPTGEQTLVISFIGMEPQKLYSQILISPVIHFRNVLISFLMILIKH